MISLSKIVVRGQTADGPFLGELDIRPGLNVFSAPNAHGKSLAVTSIAWCLGIEPMFGLQDNDPSKFPTAVRDIIDLEQGPGLPVISSEASIELLRDDGARLRLTRGIHNPYPERVEVEEMDCANNSIRKSVLHARKKTMADETGGLQRFLYSWIGLPHVPVMSVRNGQSQVYLENLAPLFFIDQSEGWTDLQALQVYRYGLEDIAEVVVEYLLGATSALRIRFRDQEEKSNDARQKAAAEGISARVQMLFQRQGFVLNWSTRGSPSEIAKRWGARPLLDLAREEFRMDVATEQRSLQDRASGLKLLLASKQLDRADLTAGSEASQQVVELKTRRHELRLALRTARTQHSEQQRLLDSLEHRHSSSSDVLRLKQLGIGRLERVECPTCHRELDPAAFELTEQSMASVGTYIEALKKERLLVLRNIESVQEEILRLGVLLQQTEEKLLIAQRGLEIVNVSTGSVPEQLGKAAVDLAAVEGEIARNRAWADEIAQLQQEIHDWVAGVASAESGEGEDDDLKGRLTTFSEHFRQTLKELDHSAVTDKNLHEVRLDESYTPYLGPRRLRSLGSASDHPRLVAAFVLALAEAGSVLKSPHPGFVVLDEPLQQNPDPEHRRKALKFLEGIAAERKCQTIVFTSLEADEIKRLQVGGVQVRALEGEHFLRRG